MDWSELEKAAPHLTGKWRRDYVHRLIKWYRAHHRDLPWRHTRDPYAIWLSESMLQQTQVSTVLSYYERFLKQYPDVQSLARADEQSVLALWAGLGYYRRARQLHAAAKAIVEQHAGRFPSDPAQLQELPGIGRYTAGAIASFAFDQPAPIVEANTERVYARLIKLRAPLRDPATTRLLWMFAQWQLSDCRKNDSPVRHLEFTQRPSIINQAAMELGSLVCKPMDPDCSHCPLIDLCPTAAAGLQKSIPAAKPKQTLTPLHHVGLIIGHKNKWLVRCNPSGAWWHGLWDFPRFDATELGWLTAQKKNRTINDLKLSAGKSQQLQSLGRTLLLSAPPNSTTEDTALDRRAVATFSIGEPVLSLSHGVTRFRITLDCYQAQLQPKSARLGDGWQWVEKSELAILPLTATAKRIARHLQLLDAQ